VTTALLSTHALSSFYGDFQALFDIDLTVCEGETVAIIGANGAGKSTLLNTIAGLLRVPAEAVRFRGEPIGGVLPYTIAAQGIALVPEGRRLFPSLSVEENLLVGAQGGRRGGWNLARVYQLFPILASRRANPATSLSGGEQQMAAIGRALMSNPTLLMCDEISLGLAPIVIAEIYRALRAILQEGIATIIVEQDINAALAAADRVYCLQHGRISLSGHPHELTKERISVAYFGV
jgi:branched-chain amino acid transport system ATP-binding protein